MFYHCFPLSKEHMNQIETNLSNIVQEWLILCFGKSVSVIEICANACLGNHKLHDESVVLSKDGLSMRIEVTDMCRIWECCTGQSDIQSLTSDQTYIVTSALHKLIEMIMTDTHPILKHATIDQASKPYSAWLLCSMKIGNAAIDLMLPTEATLKLSNYCSDIHSEKILDYVPFKDAITQAKVSVKASLGTIKLSIDDLQNLEIGDVLPVATLLSGYLSVDTSNNECVAMGQLGSINGKRAIVLRENRSGNE